MNEFESILPLLCCPITGNSLQPKKLEFVKSSSENSEILDCEFFLVTSCGQFAYPVIRGIPHLLRERALTLPR